MTLAWTRFLDCIVDRADLETRNRIAPRLWDAAHELKSRGALGRLVPLMDHANHRVRLDVAIASLDVEPQKAATILEGFARRAHEEFDMMARGVRSVSGAKATPLSGASCESRRRSRARKPPSRVARAGGLRPLDGVVM